MAGPLIQTIIATTREGRKGDPVGRWFAEIADRRDDLEHELVDLAEWELPELRTSTPPSRGEYSGRQQEWADNVDRADGFVWLTAEYNHGYPAPLKNALDLIYAEWNRKPVSFVSYGGSSGGVRAVEQLRLVAVELKMAPLRANVAIPRVFRQVEDGHFDGDEFVESANRMLDDLLWWAQALAAARSREAERTAS